MIHQIIETVSLFVLSVIETLGYVGVFVLMALESANIPVPSEVIMPFAGFLAAEGSFNFWPVVFLGALGNLGGSLISYYLARYYGLKPLHFLAQFYLVHESHIATAERWLQKHGNLSAFIARFVPVIRTFISYPAGMFRVNVFSFSVLTFLGSLVWSWLLTYLGFVLGENWDILGQYFRKIDYIIAFAIIAAGAWALYGNIKKR